MKKVGVREAQELGFASRRLQGPCCYGRLLAGKSRQVGSMWLGSGAFIDEEMGLLHGMYGSMEAELEVQRTIKRAELTAFLCLLMRVIGPVKVHVDNKGIIDGLWRGEKENAPNQELEMPMSVEVEHVKAPRTKKDKKEMLHLEKFVTEGNEKADDLAEAGSMLDEGFMAEARGETLQQEREEVYAALQYAASFHCLLEEWKDCEELKPKLEEKLNFVDQKKEGRNIERSGDQQVSVHEV